MSIKHLILYCTIFFSLLACDTNQSIQRKNSLNDKPNILIIHIDDLGYHDLSINGSKIYQTPNIDKLSTESIVFSNAYANYPRCVPSRFAMMTAGYPIQNGDVPDDGFKIGNVNNNYIKKIKNCGYKTAYFGKWHLGNKKSIKDFGFDISVAAGRSGSPISYLYPFNVKKHKGNFKKVPIPDIDEIAKDGDYLTDVLTDQVIKYIKNRDKTKPFMAMLAFYAVHQPLEAKKEDIQRNRKEIKAFDFGNQPDYIKEGTGRTKMKQNNATYAAMVENMDENVGKILSLLKKLGIEDNTIIVFSSDHGGLSNDGYRKRNLATSNFPLRAGKGHLYEGGIKVPLFIKWKNHIKPHVDNKSLVMLMDIFPTLYDIISGKSLKTDGKSLLKVINNQETWKNRTIFWHSSKARPKNTGDSKSSAVRKGNYKLIHFYEKNEIELYNILKDPYEKINLAEKEKDKKEELLIELNKWKSDFSIENKAVNIREKHNHVKPKGKNIIDKFKIRYLSKDSDYGKIIKIEGNSKDSFIYKVITKLQPKFIYNLATSIPVIASSYKKGRVFLLSFKAKTLASDLETGEAKVLFLFRQSDSYKDNIENTVSLASEWKTYYVPFQGTLDIQKKHFGIVMQYGYRPQTFLIKDIKFESFVKGTDKNILPKTKIKYFGMDVNAKWRDEAFKRIEKIRKGDFTIKLKRHGKEIVGKKVEIELVKHSFKFGAALNAKDIVNNSKEYRNFKSAFNLVVLKNDLKIKRWSKKKKRKVTLQALDILKRDEIDVKGHVLIWPGLSYLTPAVKENVNNPEKVKKIIFNHVRNILKETNGKVSHWDVVNEAYTNQDLQKITGSEKILYQGFRIAKNNYPDIERYTNEYGIISKGGIDIKKQQWYYKYIQRIDDFTGGLVDGIGIQCHIGSDLTAPHKVIEILDFYAALNKKISISEFTMDIQENAIREKYTRDFIIAAFSHPNVSEFLFWGCTQDEKNTVDIFKQNGDLGIMGKAYFDLVFDKWKTRLIEKTDRSGKILGRGFYGIYKYSFSDGGKQITGRFKVSPNKSNEIIIDVK